MMEEDLRELLSSVVNEDVVKVFEDEEIYDVETLLSLSKEMVARLVPKVGPQAKLLARLEKLKKSVEEGLQDVILSVDDLDEVARTVIAREEKRAKKSKEIRDPEVVQDASNNNIVPRIFSDTPVIVAIGNSKDTITADSLIPLGTEGSSQPVSQAGCSQPFPGNPSTSDVFLERAQGTKRPLPCVDGDYNVKMLCRATLNGNKVLGYFAMHGNIDEYHRSLLGDVVLSEYLKNDYDKKLPREVEELMFESLHKDFPNENKDYWVSPNLNARDKSSGRGKMLERDYNMRRILLKSGLLQKKNASTNSTRSNLLAADEDDLDEVSIQDSMLWLHNNKQPWPKVLESWKLTSKKRLHSLLNGTQTVHEYMDSYPPLKDPLGYTLLEVDFETLFQTQSMRLYTEWIKLSAFVLHKVPQSVADKINDCFTSDGKRVKTIQALSYLFPVVSVAKKGKKQQWRPSREEVGQALVLHVETAGSIKQALDLRRKKYEVYGLQLGPQAIVVGEDIDSISKSYVQVNKILYEVDNPMKAVDLTFKIMHSLDADYHKECGREWLFLQKAIYALPLQGNKKEEDMKVQTLVSEYQSYQSS